jgi:hypothetical protein
MNTSIKLLDTIAVTENIPEHNLYRGQVGTIVEILAPNTYEVEFVDNEGQTYAMLALNTNQFLVLHYHFLQAA